MDTGAPELPGPVRARLAQLVAVALPGMATADVPPALGHLVRFTPAKRARLGGGPLVSAVLTQPRFRAAVLAELSSGDPSLLDPVDAVSAAVAAVLAEAPDAAELLAVAAGREEHAAVVVERDAAVREVERLRGLLSAAAEEVAALRSHPPVPATGSEEAARLRTRLREQGARLRTAQDRVAELEAGATVPPPAADAAELARVLAERDRARADLAAERARAERAVRERDAAVAAAREARAADEVRLGLLLDTLDGVAGGLRAELGLPAGRPASGPSPAAGVAARGTAGAGRRVGTLAELDRVLALPSVHLVVDGYNVTKTGYGHLELMAQRDRLVRDLGLLAARTGSEVTVVFDGAAVVATGGSVWARGVRVLFSPAGVIADDVVRELVRAEPGGRPVVVVSSDREVAVSVLAAGAHSVPSVLLLERVAR